MPSISNKHMIETLNFKENVNAKTKNDFKCSSQSADWCYTPWPSVHMQLLAGSLVHNGPGVHMTPDCSFNHQALQILSVPKGLHHMHWSKHPEVKRGRGNHQDQLLLQCMNLFIRPQPCRPHARVRPASQERPPSHLWTALTASWLVVTIRANKSVTGLGTGLCLFSSVNTSQQESL